MKTDLCFKLFATGVTFLPSATVIAQETKPERPNILFIMCDDLIAYNGIYKDYPKAITPHLDALREKSVNFTNAHSVAPVSAPARAALFTGVYPHVSKNYGFNTWYNNPVLSKGKTMFKHLQDGGYAVYGTGKLLHHNRKSEFTQFGIDNYAGPLAFDGKQPAYHPSVPRPYAEIGPLDGTFGSLADIPNVPPSDDAPGYHGWYDIQRKKPFRYVNDDDRDLLRDEEHAQWVIKRLKELEQNKDGKPFFIGMGLSKPHTALIAPQKYFDMYPLEDICLPQQQTGESKNLGHLKENTPDSKGYKHFEAMKASYPDNLEYGLKKYMQAYLASVSFADDVIGSVLDALEQSAFAQNTIVVFVSDHGYDFGQKDYLFKNSLWETSTSIPFYVYCPMGCQKGTEVTHPVSLIDIYPTINELCGLDNNTVIKPGGAELSGYSLVPFLEEGDATQHWQGPDVALTLVGGSVTYEGSQNYSVRSKDWRYIHYENGKEELYHNAVDPYEWNNLADSIEYADIKKAFYDKLVRLVPQVDNPLTDAEIPELVENILKNGDFENTYASADIKLPTDWVVTQDPHVNTAVSITSNGIDKSNCLKLGFASTATYCEVSQQLQLTPGKDYGFCGYCYYSGQPSQSGNSVIELISENGQVVASYSIPTTGTMGKEVDKNDKSVYRFFRFTPIEANNTLKLKSNGIDKLIRFDNLVVGQIQDATMHGEVFADSDIFFEQWGRTIRLKEHIIPESVSLYSFDGKNVYAGGSDHVIDLEMLSGIYLMCAKTDSGERISTKLKL